MPWSYQSWEFKTAVLFSAFNFVALHSGMGESKWNLIPIP